MQNDNPYLDLRNMALNTSAAQLGLNFSENITSVYGLVMDLGLASGAGVVTLTAFQSGDASIYFSSGGGFIGGGQHESVATAAKQYVQFAQNYLATAVATSDCPLSEKGEVIFYFLTNQGIFKRSELLLHLENNSSPLSAVFVEANKVISAIRIISTPKTPGPRR